MRELDDNNVPRNDGQHKHYENNEYWARHDGRFLLCLRELGLGSCGGRLRAHCAPRGAMDMYDKMEASVHWKCDVL